jgi:hypothetical protein
MSNNGDVDAPPKLHRWDDHEIARLRRMYARHLFVVVGIFGDVLPLKAAFPTVSLASARLIGYTLAS